MRDMSPDALRRGPPVPDRHRYTRRSYEQRAITFLHDMGRFSASERKQRHACAAGSLAAVCALTGENVAQVCDRLHIAAYDRQQMLASGGGAARRLARFDHPSCPPSNPFA